MEDALLREAEFRRIADFGFPQVCASLDISDSASSDPWRQRS